MMNSNPVRTVIGLCLIALMALAVACGEAPEPEIEKPGDTLPVFDPAEHGMVEQDDGSFLLEKPGMAPVRLIIPEQPDDGLKAPDGIFMRPGVEIFPVNAQKQVHVFIDEELSMPEDAPVYLRVTGPMVQELSAVKPGDGLLLDGTPGFVATKVLADGDDLLIATESFHLGKMVWGNFRLEFPMPHPTGHFMGKDTDSGHSVEQIDSGLELPERYDGLLDVSQQALEIPIAGMDIEVARTFGSAPLEAEVKATGSVRMYVTGEFKGVFEGRIGRVVGSDYTCLNPDDRRLWGHGDLCVDRLAVYAESGIDIEVKAKAEVSGKLTSACCEGWEREFGGFEFPIPNTPLTVGGNPFVKWGIEFEATLEASVEASWTGGPRVPFGFEYINNTRYRSPNLTGNPDDGSYLIPNSRIPARFDSGGVELQGVEGTGYLGAKPFVEGGVKFKVGNVGPDVVRLVGAKIALRGEYEMKWQPIQDVEWETPCWQGTGKLFGVVAPDLTFQVGIEGVKTWKKNLFCSGEGTCAQLKTPNVFEFFRVPERYWKHTNDDVCIETPEYTTLRIIPTSDEPMGFEDVEGYDVDAIVLSRRVQTGRGLFTNREWTASGGPSKLQGRPDSNCDNFSSKVAGITGPTEVTFPVRLKTGDTITVVQTQQAAGCEGSGTARFEVENRDGTKVVGVLEQNGELVIP